MAMAMESDTEDLEARAMDSNHGDSGVMAMEIDIAN